DYIHTRNNRVEYCEIFNTSYDLGDSNAVYIHTSNEGNTVYYCYIHDLENPHAGAALRTDNIQRHGIFSHNIIQNVRGGGGISASYNTIVRNNYVIDTGRTIYLHQGPWPNTSLIEKNICYFSPRNKAIPYRRRCLPIHLSKAHETWKLRTVRPDWNLFFSTSYSEEEKASFAQRPDTVMGPNSLYADPQFEDIKSFRLRKTSPAFRLGIEPLNRSLMGLLREPCKIRYQ
ncbi:MAG: right-handed parallel beta-helix repeat-containing protein, partial [Lentisphaerae bacterium]